MGNENLFEKVKIRFPDIPVARLTRWQRVLEGGVRFLDIEKVAQSRFLGRLIGHPNQKRVYFASLEDYDNSHHYDYIITEGGGV